MFAYFLTFIAIGVCLMLGQLLLHLTGWPVPAALLGMAVLFVALLAMPRLPKVLEQVSGWMLRHLVLWILPSALGVIAYTAVLQQHWLPIVLAGVLGTAMTAVVTSVVFRFMLRWTGSSAETAFTKKAATNGASVAVSDTAHKTPSDKRDAP